MSLDSDAEIVEELKLEVAYLRIDVARLKQEAEYYKNCILALTTGNIPQGASLQQFGYAMQGRKIARLLDKGYNETNLSQEDKQ